MAARAVGSPHVLIVWFEFPGSGVAPFLVSDSQNLLFPFPFAKSTLTPDIHDQIDKIARFVAATWSLGSPQLPRTWAEFRPIHRITLVGHADPRGSDAFNKALGLDRAEAVRDKLKQRITHHRSQSTVDRIQIGVKSAGESDPLAITHPERRVVEVNLDRSLDATVELTEAVAAAAKLGGANLNPSIRATVQCLLTQLADLNVDDKFLPLHLANNNLHDPAKYPHLRDRVLQAAFRKRQSTTATPIWKHNGDEVLSEVVRFVDEFHRVVGALAHLIGTQGIAARNADEKRAWLNGLKADSTSIIHCFQ
jgi:outer membrane protein OmpA-like peptidoglycan-associated protein